MMQAAVCCPGTLPASWQTLAQLQYVILSNNSLQGTLPPWGVGSLPQLITLDLSHNQVGDSAATAIPGVLAA